MTKIPQSQPNVPFFFQARFCAFGILPLLASGNSPAESLNGFIPVLEISLGPADGSTTTASLSPGIPSDISSVACQGPWNPFEDWVTAWLTVLWLYSKLVETSSNRPSPSVSLSKATLTNVDNPVSVSCKIWLSRHTAARELVTFVLIRLTAVEVSSVTLKNTQFLFFFLLLTTLQ